MKARPVLVFLTMMTWTASALAQDAADAKVKATHEELRALREGVLKAIKAKDADGLIAYLHPDVVLTTQDGKELKVIRKHAEVRDYLKRMLTGPNAGIKS